MSMEWGFHVGADGIVRGVAIDVEPVHATEAELRQWWQTLGLALLRQGFPRLDVLNISAGDVRDRCNTLLQQRREPHEAFQQAVFEVGEDAFVKLVGVDRDD